jgi:hypothetical protein
VAVAALDDQLITMYPGKNYAVVWGTSSSAALVSGGAALLRHIDANIGTDQATAPFSQAVFLGPDLRAGRIDLCRACRYWLAQKTISHRHGPRRRHTSQGPYTSDGIAHR